MTDRASEPKLTCWIKSPSHSAARLQQVAGVLTLSQLSAVCDSLDAKQCKLMRFDMKSNGNCHRTYTLGITFIRSALVHEHLYYFGMGGQIAKDYLTLAATYQDDQ